MANVAFALSFLPPGSSSQVPAFLPGESISGSIQITPQESLKCRHLYARLRWFTEGRGDTDKKVIAEQDLHQGELRAGVPFYSRFQFRLPSEPWSYTGHYINIIWEVEVVIDMALARDPRQGLRFILAPSARQ
jgi:hypothetical protein